MKNLRKRLACLLLSALLLIGCLYFFVRILGKYLGAFLGCKICKKPNRTTNTLGLALIRGRPPRRR